MDDIGALSALISAIAGSMLVVSALLVKLIKWLALPPIKDVVRGELKTSNGKLDAIETQVRATNELSAGNQREIITLGKRLDRHLTERHGKR